jgi:hypothetical protein
LKRVLDDQIVFPVVQTQEKKAIDSADSWKFVNPFPSEPVTTAVDMIKTSFHLMEALRWSKEILTNLMRVVQLEVKQKSRLLLLKNEPILLLHLFKYYKQCAKREVLNNMYTYGLNKTIKDSIINSHADSFELEKGSVLVILYCVIQLRNPKAASFNVLYIVIADVIKRQINTNPNFNLISTSMLNLLHSNKLIKEDKQQDLFETDPLCSFKDNGCLYQSMFKLCSTSLSNKELLKDLMLFKRNHSIAISKTLLQMLDIENIPRPFDSIKKYEITKGKEYMEYLYTFNTLIENGKFDELFKKLKNLLIDVLDNTPNCEVSMTLIIVSLSWLLSLLCIIKGSPIRSYEIPTFLNKALAGNDLITVFEQLKAIKVNINIKLTVFDDVPLDCNKELYKIYCIVAILVQLSEYKLAIDLLFDSDDLTYLLLAVLLLNKKPKDYLHVGIDKFTTLINDYPRIIGSSINKETPNIFSTCIISSNKTIGYSILLTTLPKLLFYLQSLLQTPSIRSEQLISIFTYKKINIKPCTLIYILMNKLNVNAIQSFSNKYFLSDIQALMFNHLLNEIIQILAASYEIHLIEFNKIENPKSDYIKVRTTALIAEDIKTIIIDIVQFI